MIFLIAVGGKFTRTSEWHGSEGTIMPIDTVLQRVIVDKDNVIKYVGCFYTGLRSQREKEHLPKIEWFSDSVYWRETGISKSVSA